MTDLGLNTTLMTLSAAKVSTPYAPLQYLQLGIFRRGKDNQNA